MFKRLLLDDSTALVTLAAFIVAASIFITFVWRAIRMSRRQCERFENLPFETPTPAVGSPSLDFARDPEPVEGLAATSVDRSEQAPTLQKAAETFRDES
jgi:hypothetical protein